MISGWWRTTAIPLHHNVNYYMALCSQVHHHRRCFGWEIFFTYSSHGPEISFQSRPDPRSRVRLQAYLYSRRRQNCQTSVLGHSRDRVFQIHYTFLLPRRSRLPPCLWCHKSEKYVIDVPKHSNHTLIRHLQASWIRSHGLRMYESMLILISHASLSATKSTFVTLRTVGFPINSGGSWSWYFTLAPSKPRQVTTEEGAEFAHQEGLLFVEASAKSGHNVELAFMEATKDILTKIKNNVFDDSRVCSIQFLIYAYWIYFSSFSLLAWKHQATQIQIVYSNSPPNRALAADDIFRGLALVILLPLCKSDLNRRGHVTCEWGSIQQHHYIIYLIFCELQSPRVRFGHRYTYHNHAILTCIYK